MVNKNVDEWVVDIVEGFLKSPVWRTPIMSFVEEHCIVFDTDEENKLAYMDVFKAYGALVERMLEGYIQELGLDPEDFLIVCRNKWRDDKDNRLLYETVLAADDFLAFKKFMVQRNIELEMQVLRVSGTTSDQQGSSAAAQSNPQQDEEELIQQAIAMSINDSNNANSGDEKFNSEMTEACRLSKEANDLLQKELAELAKREQEELDMAIALSLSLADQERLQQEAMDQLGKDNEEKEAYLAMQRKLEAESKNIAKMKANVERELTMNSAMGDDEKNKLVEEMEKLKADQKKLQEQQEELLKQKDSRNAEIDERNKDIQIKLAEQQAKIIEQQEGIQLQHQRIQEQQEQLRTQQERQKIEEARLEAERKQLELLKNIKEAEQGVNASGNVDELKEARDQLEKEKKELELERKRVIEQQELLKLEREKKEKRRKEKKEKKRSASRVELDLKPLQDLKGKQVLPQVPHEAPSKKSEASTASAADAWIEEAKAEPKDERPSVSFASGPSLEEIQRRSLHHAHQRQSLIMKKKEMREKQLQDFSGQSNSKSRPSITDEPLPTLETGGVDKETLAMRKALAARIRQDVVDKMKD
eukprot:Nk52_evm96s226 gene=Nk52_evmTU96s226